MFACLKALRPGLIAVCCATVWPSFAQILNEVVVTATRTEQLVSEVLTDVTVIDRHTFHYSTCQSTAAVRQRTSRPGQEPKPDVGEALFQLGPVQASYFHAWFASNPVATAVLFTGQA